MTQLSKTTAGTIRRVQHFSLAADSIRGDGLIQAHIALAALVEDPEEFDQARERRFEKSPPSYRSRPGTPTQPASPVDEDDPLTKYIARWDELRMDLMASKAADQFMTQHREELLRIEQAGDFPGVGRSDADLAGDRVKERWVEQGIWGPKWYESNLERWGELVLDAPLLDALWLHEAPLDDDKSETDEVGTTLMSQIFGNRRAQPKTEEEARQSTERRAERRRRREVTRPIHQFNYQVSQERERLVRERTQEVPENKDVVRRCPPDISTQAYTIVKDRWVSRRIWVDKWGILPGMTWLHERNFDELVLKELGPRPPSRTAAAASSETVPAAPPFFSFGSPGSLP